MCGNLGLLLGEDCAFSAEDAAEAMTRVVAMRRAVVWVLARDAVATKRAPRGATETS